MSTEKDIKLTVAKKTVNIEWKIENFITKIDKPILVWTSSSFHFANASFHFKISYSRSINYSDNIRVHLIKEDHEEIPTLTSEFGIKLEDGSVIHIIKSVIIKMTLIHFLEKKQIFKFKHLYAPNGTMTYVLSVSLDENSKASETNFDDFKIASNKVCQADDRNGAEILMKNLKDLLLNGESSDVTIKVGNQEFQAHRSILVARSPVFASMFRHDMTEASTGIINIPDCSPAAFKELLMYIYCGNTENLSVSIVCDLYEASAKYGLEYLQEKCSIFMQINLSVDAFCDIIATAMRHGDTELVNNCVTFFAENLTNILPTVKWQNFLKENPVSANELFLNVAKGF